MMAVTLSPLLWLPACRFSPQQQLVAARQLPKAGRACSPEVRVRHLMAAACSSTENTCDEPTAYY
ncbi:MAG: hypothetical protein AAGJ80_12350 [Cyanobacteria bacterium J06553_1]